MTKEEEVINLFRKNCKYKEINSKKGLIYGNTELLLYCTYK